jgi:hypothetical protein
MAQQPENRHIACSQDEGMVIKDEVQEGVQ